MNPFQDDIVREDLESQSPPAGLYRNSKGALVEIAKMAFPHLKSALQKLVREEPYRIGEIDDLYAEINRREAEYAAQAEEKAS